MKSVTVLVGFIAVFVIVYGKHCRGDERDYIDGHFMSDGRECDDLDGCVGWNHEEEGCSPCRRQCPNGYCIPEWWLCDGFNDCGDWRDEPDDCPPCKIGHWRCPNENCIPDLWSTFVMQKMTKATNTSEHPIATHVRFIKSN